MDRGAEGRMTFTSFTDFAKWPLEEKIPHWESMERFCRKFKMYHTANQYRALIEKAKKKLKVEE
jgi:hypothetical protein